MKKLSDKINRREFLDRTGRIVAATSLAAGALSISSPSACAQNQGDDLDNYDFILPRVQFTDRVGVQDRWNVRPGGDANLLDELSKVIRCKVKPILRTNNWSPDRAGVGQLNAIVTLDDLETMSKYPFLFMTGESYYDLSETQRVNLKTYIHQGGFILMDECMVDPAGDFFYQSSVERLNEIFGAGALKRVPNHHEVFNNVYDLSRIGLPYVQAQNHGARGIFVGDRLAIFLSSTDIHCGWCDRDNAVFGKGKRKGLGIHGYKEAIQMGINIIMYALSH